MNEVIIKQVPEIVVRVLVNPISLWVSIFLSFLTFLAVVVALFQERIRKYWNRAVLDMEINLFRPDCHQIWLSRGGQFTEPSIYIRIKVNHKKGSAGENVEIIPISFRRIIEKKEPQVLKHFLPISLAWSHFQPRTNIVRVPVNLFRHCDFGHFVQYEDTSQTILILDTMIQPNPVAGGEVPNHIKPGKYQFQLKLSGDNVKALTKKWEIEFEQWSDDESEMLNHNIKLREVSETEN